MKASEAFEQQIHRIHELLDGSDADVTWNDRIPDPDNLAQPRQIDITIRRDGKLTIVECRIHKARQQVKWIEELIGRRQSLAADATIAVSSSGFTKGALAKAKRYGILVRDLRELTDQEIESWGRLVELTLYFYQYSDLEIGLLFNAHSIPKLDDSLLKAEMKSYPGIQSLFNAAAQELGTINLLDPKQSNVVVKFNIQCRLEDFRLCGEDVVEVGFRGSARLLSKKIMSPAVFTYGVPSTSAMQRDAVIERFELGETSIIHDAARVSILLDVSRLEIPRFCQFRFARVSSPEQMDIQSFALQGVDKLWVPGGRMKIRIAMASESHNSALQGTRDEAART